MRNSIKETGIQLLVDVVFFPKKNEINEDDGEWNLYDILCRWRKLIFRIDSVQVVFCLQTSKKIIKWLVKTYMTLTLTLAAADSVYLGMISGGWFSRPDSTLLCTAEDDNDRVHEVSNRSRLLEHLEYITWFFINNAFTRETVLQTMVENEPIVLFTIRSNFTCEWQCCCHAIADLNEETIPEHHQLPFPSVVLHASLTSTVGEDIITTTHHGTKTCTMVSNTLEGYL